MILFFDSIEKEIMDLEQALIATGKRDCVSEIISLRKRLMVLKKILRAVSECTGYSGGEREQGFLTGRPCAPLKCFTEERSGGFKNVLNLREYVTQVRESYEAEVDISLNTTMKIFTVVTTIFCR